MSDGLKKAAGTFTKDPGLTPIRSWGTCRFVVTAVIRAAAPAVMVVGFVHRGLMTLTQPSSHYERKHRDHNNRPANCLNIGAYACLIAAIGLSCLFCLKEPQTHRPSHLRLRRPLSVGDHVSVQNPGGNHCLQRLIVDLGKTRRWCTSRCGHDLCHSGSSASSASCSASPNNPLWSTVSSSLLPLTSAIPILFGDNIGTTITALAHHRLHQPQRQTHCLGHTL